MEQKVEVGVKNKLSELSKVCIRILIVGWNQLVDFYYELKEFDYSIQNIKAYLADRASRFFGIQLQVSVQRKKRKFKNQLREIVSKRKVKIKNRRSLLKLFFKKSGKEIIANSYRPPS